MNNEEMDIYIKGKIKDNKIPEKIDNLFNNSAKILENKGDKQMEENLNMNQKQEQNQNNQNKPEKKKMPVALKRVLAVAACLTLLLGGGNIYATSQGYDNIFFMIKYIISGQEVNEKDNILSDREINISNKQIDVSQDISVEISSLIVKDNKAKLNLKAVNFSVFEDEQKSRLRYEIRDEEENTLCSYVGKEFNKNVAICYEELIIEKFSDNIKKLSLMIYENNTNQKISNLIIDLEKREVVINQNEEMEKVSEVELKKYLSIFANLVFPWQGESNSVPDNYEVDKIILAAIELGEEKQILNYTNLGYNAQDIVNIAKAFITEETLKNDNKIYEKINIINDNLKTYDCCFYIRTNQNNKIFYKNIDQSQAHSRCLTVDDISYLDGIYKVTFKHFYDGLGPYEDLPKYKTTILLKLNKDTSISKYSIVEIRETELITESKEDNKNDVIDNNEVINDMQSQKTIQGFLNIISSHEGSSEGMLQIEEIGLIRDYDEWNKIWNNNQRDSEGYVKTHIEYSTLKNRMLQYMTEELFGFYSYSYKNVDDVLWVRSTGASGYLYKVESVKSISSSENIITYEVVYSIESFEGALQKENQKFELQKNQNGKYVVSAWGWQIEEREEAKQQLQNYLDLLSAYEGTPAHLLYKLNLISEKEFNDIIRNSGHHSSVVKFSNYKKEMLNYVSENWFNQKFVTLYNKTNDENEYLQFEHLGSSVGTNEVISVTWKEDIYMPNYVAQVCTIASDGVKGEAYNIEFTLETIMENNKKKTVISYCENPKY